MIHLVTQIKGIDLYLLPHPSHAVVLNHPKGGNGIIVGFGTQLKETLLSIRAGSNGRTEGFRVSFQYCNGEKVGRS